METGGKKQANNVKTRPSGGGHPQCWRSGVWGDCWQGCRLHSGAAQRAGTETYCPKPAPDSTQLEGVCECVRLLNMRASRAPNAEQCCDCCITVASMSSHAIEPLFFPKTIKVHGTILLQLWQPNFLQIYSSIPYSLAQFNYGTNDNMESSQCDQNQCCSYLLGYQMKPTQNNIQQDNIDFITIFCFY